MEERKSREDKLVTGRSLAFMILVMNILENMLPNILALILANVLSLVLAIIFPSILANILTNILQIFWLAWWQLSRRLTSKWYMLRSPQFSSSQFYSMRTSKSFLVSTLNTSTFSISENGTSVITYNWGMKWFFLFSMMLLPVVITHCWINFSQSRDNSLSRIINQVTGGEMTHCQILHFHSAGCTKISHKPIQVEKVVNVMSNYFGSVVTCYTLVSMFMADFFIITWLAISSLPKVSQKLSIHLFG